MKQIMLGFVVSLILIINYSCSDEIVSPNFDGQFNYGDTVSIEFNSFMVSKDGKVEIGFIDVPEDSRCPMNEFIVCDWEGNAQAKFYIKQEDKRTEFKLNTYYNWHNDTTIAGINVKLIRLLPWPKTTEPISKEKYFAEILVSKNQ